MSEGESGVLKVAKKKSTPKEGKSGGPESWNRKPLIANFRGSQEFKGWLQELATHDRESVAGVIERALVLYAKFVGFEKQPPER